MVKKRMEIPRFCREIFALILMVFGSAGAQTLVPPPGSSPLVFQSPEGTLTYQPFSGKGDVIPDYSMCGYMGGGVRIPDVPEVITLQPRDKQSSDSKRIQDAIDRVSSRSPEANGFRGAVLLEKGEYRIDEPLLIKTSGVVLRGQGKKMAPF